MVVKLKTESLTDLAEMADHYGLAVDDLLHQALKAYRRHLEETKIQTEKQQFLRQHSELKKVYQGQFVAVHYGKVVDHDNDFESLHQRIRQKYGREAILIRRVEEEPDRPLVWRTPRLTLG